jgi:magnesium transporter
MSSSPRSISRDRDGSPTLYRRSSLDSETAAATRRSITLSRSYNPLDPDARERQRTLDVDLAMHLSRARHGSVSVSPEASPLVMREHDDREPEIHPHHEETTFPSLFLQEEREMEIARGELPRRLHIDDPYQGTLTPNDLRQDLDMTHHLAERHGPHLLGPLHNATHQFDGTLPLYQPPAMLSRVTFNFQAMEDFAVAEKTRLGLANNGPDERFQHLRMRKPSQASAIGEVGSSGGSGTTDFRLPTPHALRERKLSQSNALPRRHGGGKMALFEGIPGAPPASLAAGLAPPLSVVPSFADLSSAEVNGVGHDRPYRFSFYSNALGATIHARSLSELPADGQSFEDMFAGVCGPVQSPAEPERRTTPGTASTLTTPFIRTPREDAKVSQGGNGGELYKSLIAPGPEGHTWWLDVLSPTDEEMKMLSKVRRVYL